MTMKLDNTKYIVEDLIAKGLVTSDNKDKVAEVIAAGGETNKEYQTKKWILHYLEYYSGCAVIEEADIDEVYSTIKAKYKDDFKLEKETVRFDVLNYLRKEKKLNTVMDCSERVNLANLVDDIFRPFQVVGYRTILK